MNRTNAAQTPSTHDLASRLDEAPPLERQVDQVTDLNKGPEYEQAQAQLAHHAGALNDVPPGFGSIASLKHAPGQHGQGQVHVPVTEVRVPPERASTPRHRELLRLRGSAAELLPNRPAGWTGRLEAEFRWGAAAVDGIPEGYHWTINDQGLPNLVRDRRVDGHGNLVPPRRFDDTAPPNAPPEQRFPLRPDDVERARSTLVESTYTSGARTHQEQQQAMARREQQLQRRDTAEAEVERLRQQFQVSEEQLSSAQFDQTIERLRREHANEPEVLRQIDDLVRERKTVADARNQVSEGSMRIGQLMASDWVASRYPQAGLPIHGGVGAPSRSGDFDAVYLVPRGEGQRPLILIVEAKGGMGTLGTRDIGGVRHEQGTRDYRSAMRDVLTGNVDVRYLLVEAPLGTRAGQPVLRPGRVSEFDISPRP